MSDIGRISPALKSKRNPIYKKTTGIFFQTIGKPAQATVLSLSRQIVYLLPTTLLPLALGVEGALWAGLLADAPAFITTLVMLKLYWKKFKNIRLSIPADGAKKADKAVPPGHPD